MTEEIKQEAIDQLELDIKFGFENEEELFESIREMFYNESEFDESWLREKISEQYSKHQIESQHWGHPTDFERLAKTFDELITEKIVCLHNAGFTRSDGEGDCMETIERLEELGIKAIGFCYYHSQDLGRAVDPESRNLYLGFNSVVENDNEAILIANRIIQKLKKNGFDVDWSGTVDQRIEIKDMDWKKIPDDQDWGIERVVQILSKLKDDRNPFWKFW
jgi:hypothetical protein